MSTYQVTHECRSAAGTHFSHPPETKSLVCPCGAGIIRMPDPDVDVPCGNCDRIHSRRSEP